MVKAGIFLNIKNSFHVQEFTVTIWPVEMLKAAKGTHTIIALF
jgi:hypothetical protein